ncbi:MAG: hypothetical protein O8C61_03270 [Candidatus Methanoperedens sp.]|nr:hypothetical protein [Candidatus Methanoperedens sp.]
MSSNSPDLDLSKVRSFEKRQELFNILHSEDACHYERLYLVGFLKFVGYSLEEICALIDKEASWCDYDATMTYCQVQSVFKSDGKDDEAISSQFRKEAEAAENPLQRVFIERSTDKYTPKICIIGNSRITCHYKKCDSCKLKVAS